MNSVGNFRRGVVRMPIDDHGHGGLLLENMVPQGFARIKCQVEIVLFTTNCFMSLRSPTEHDNGGFSWRLVIPAQAGIHPYPNLDTGFRRYDGTLGLLCYHLRVGIFQGDHEGHEGLLE
jgi:predicted neutral ceramidase superfamily lipid hydrolase